MSDENVRRVSLRWEGEGLSFRGGTDDVEIVVDSESERGLSPMQLLLASVAACMAIDVVMIVQKSRVPLESVEMDAVGIRQDEVPRRYRSITLTYKVRGPGEGDWDKVSRAIELSRDKYCSALHTLDPDLVVDIQVERR